MATTNHTPTIELSQYISTDKTSYLVNYNDDMLKIDGAIATDRDNINTAQNTADTAEGKADTNKLSIDAINETLNDNTTGVLKRLGDVEGDVNTIESLIGNGTPTTTDKTIIGAINELHGNVGDLTQLATTEKSSVVGAVNELVSDVHDKEAFIGLYNHYVTADGVKTHKELISELIAAVNAEIADMPTDEKLINPTFEIVGLGYFSNSDANYWINAGGYIAAGEYSSCFCGADAVGIRTLYTGTSDVRMGVISSATHQLTITDLGATVPTDGTRINFNAQIYRTIG